MGPKRKATSPPGASPSAERGGAPNGNPKSAVGTADDDERSWATLAARVRAHGGVVHANVRVGADASGTRGLVAVGPIEEGATLFRIPGECTLTAASALRSPLGKAIAKRAAQKLVGAGSAPQDKRDGRTTDTYHLPSRSLPLGDIALAAFVAADGLDPSSPFAAYHALLRRTPLDDAPAWWPREQRDELLRGAFLGTRASRVSETLRRDAVDAFESLVREELLKHISREQKRGALRVPDAFDAWDAFRRALAAVHSRAFNFGELNDVFETGDSVCESEREERTSDRSQSSFKSFLTYKMSRARERLEREAAGSALVPLLDCANHYRKPRECAWRVSKADEKKKVTSGSVSAEYALVLSPFVEVVALRFFVSGDPVRVAYGARSNEHLLTRYGFCVKDNVEPDGSSNDETPFFLSENGVAEVPGEIAVSRDRGGRDLDASIADGNRRVFLRVATKPEYTFKPFADALDLFRARARERRDGKSAEKRVDDAFGRGPLSSAETVSAPLARDEEDFLGDFRGDGDGDEDDDDACAALMYGSGEDSGEEEEEEDPGAMPYEKKKKSGEDALLLEALNDMALSLGHRAARLARAAEETALCVPSGPGTRTDMCVTYLESEARTFNFFSRAALSAAREIAGGGDDESPMSKNSYEDVSGVSALVAAFAELRRSNARLNAAIAFC